MKSPRTAEELRLPVPGSDIKQDIDALFARLPELCGFSVQDRDGRLCVTEVGISPRFSAHQYSLIFEDIVQTLGELLDERPAASAFLSGRTFARALH